MSDRYCPVCGWTLRYSWRVWEPYCSRTCQDAEARAKVVQLHNEPLAGALALGGLCRCPICQPELYTTDEGGEA